MNTLLLIDSSVVGYELLVGAAKENISVIVFDAMVDTVESLLTKIAEKGATTFEYVGLVQHGSAISPDYSIVKTVAPALLSDSTTDDLPSWSPIVNFFKGLKETYSVKVIDLISCDLYSRQEWIEVINKLEVLADVKLRASSDATGNLVNGGNWVMESDNVNIEGLYFTDAIREFVGLLEWRTWYRKSSEMVNTTNTIPVKMISSSNPVNGMVTVQSPCSVVTWGDSANGGSSSSVSSSLTNGIVAIATTGQAFAALKSNGSVITWGSSSYGGSSSTISSSIQSGVTYIASTGGAFAALKSNGSVITWGHSSFGGNSSTVSSSLQDGITAIASTLTAFAALKSNGSIITWGDSTRGGDLSAVASSLANVTVVSIASNAYAFAALTETGKVITWGNSGYGGDSSAVASSLANVTVISITSNAYAFAALTSTGSVITWGDSANGGNSSSVSSSLTNGIVAITSNEYAFAALTGNKAVITWGNSAYGGISSHISDLSGGIVGITYNNRAFAALTETGKVITWGHSTTGGDSSVVSSSLLSGVVSIASSYGAFAALKSDGKVITWGAGIYGGNSSTVSSSLSNVTTVSIFSNYYAFAALTSTGSVITWGGTGGDSSVVSSSLSSGIITIAPASGAFTALKIVVTVPDAPTSLNAASGNGQLILTWNAPTNNGNSTITKYSVYNSGGTLVADVINGVNLYTITGLTNGTSYTYSVKAYNTAGYGAATSVTATPSDTNTYTYMSSWTPQYSSMIAAYHLNGVTTDTVGNRTMSLYGSPSFTSRSYFNSTALAFNGSQYGILPSDTSITGNTFTYALWLYWTNNINNWQRIFDFFDTGNQSNAFYFTMKSNLGTIQAGLDNTTDAIGAIITPTASLLALNTWYHVAITVNKGGLMKIYVNGQLLSSISTSISPKDAFGSSPTFSIGGKTWSNNYYGSMQNIGIWNAELTQSEIISLYTFSQAAPNPPSGTPVATAGSSSASIAFNTNGASSYTVTSSPGGLTGTGASSPITVSGLTVGTSYTFTVTATNNGATSSASSASNAITPYGPPGAPVLSAVAGNQQVALSWTVPATNGSAITKYTIYNSSNTIVADNIATTSTTLTGLTALTQYNYYIKAFNAAGYGSASSTVSATPYSPPGAPVLTAVAGNQQVALSWTAPATNGSAITKYTIYNSSNTIVADNIATTSTTLTGLSNSTSYNYYVKAFNGAGYGSPSNNAIATPRTVPDAPTGLSAVAGNQQVVISWTAPATNGAAISKYTVYNTSDVIMADNIPGTSITIMSLINGTVYTYYVKAFNAAGYSVASSTVSFMPINPSAPSINTSALVLTSVSQVAQVLQSVSTSSNTLIQEVAKNAITQVATNTTITEIMNTAKDIMSSISSSSLKANIASAAAAASVPLVASTATTASGKLSDYVARIQSVISATKADTTLINNLKDAVGGAAASVISTVGEAVSLTIPAILIAANSETGATKADVKLGAVGSVESQVSGSSVAVSVAEAPALVASIPNKTAEFATLASGGMSIIVANKDTKVVMLPADTSAWYVPMAPGVEYTFKNTLGPATAKFIYNSTTGTLTKDGQAFSIGDTFNLNGWVYPNYAIGSVGGANGFAAPTPVEVNLNVEISADGEIQILSDIAPTVDNVVVADVLLPINCLYDEAGNAGLIEFWEPENYNDIVCQLASSDQVATDAYKLTAKRLALGLEKVLCGQLNASNALPFSNYASANDNQMVGFGRLALMAYAHYLLGHVQATAAITNDKEFIRNMLSLNVSADVSNIQDADYMYSSVGNYDATVAPWNVSGSKSNANLAARLVNTIVSSNQSQSYVNTSTAGSLASIVKQVIGQDANRAVNSDNSKYTPERHGLLKFMAGDKIYVTITLNTPDVVVNQNQQVADSTIESRYMPPNNKNKYTLRITLG